MENDPTTLPILENAIRTLDLAILARPSGNPEQSFELKSAAPQWFEPTFGSAATLTERSFFLADFCSGSALDCWQGVSEIEKSALWQEDATSGETHHFEATAIQEADQDILLITHVTERHNQDQLYLQSAHEGLLDQRRIAKEQERKEILLDCIVRELGSPLSTILMNVQFVKEQLIRPDLSQALERAESQAERQRNLIHAVSHLFQADLDPLDPANLEKQPISLSQLATTAVENYRPTADLKEVALNLSPSEDPFSVSATKNHLQRVFQNLLEFTLSESLPKHPIDVTLIQNTASVRVTFTYQAPTLSDEKRAALLDPFTAPNQDSHETPPALHLYFCKMMIELWGGSIGIDSSPHESQIWFELPQLSSTNTKPS